MTQAPVAFIRESTRESFRLAKPAGVALPGGAVCRRFAADFTATDRVRAPPPPMPTESAILPPPTLKGPEFLQPLRQLYEHAGLSLPEIEPLIGEAVPLPYRHLLVHQRDMTPTLESFYGDEIHIAVLRRERQGEVYLREVVLRLDRTDRPVEFGANRVHLSRFPSEARWLILQEQLPLGRILKDHGLPHQTRALAFFRVVADAFIAKSLGVRRGEVLYGRQARIANLDGQALSEVVEILPVVRGLPPRGI